MATPHQGPFRPEDVSESNASSYPEPWGSEAAKRHHRALGRYAGLRNFGVVLTRIEPGGRSSQRHAHSTQDEFVFVLKGPVTLHDNAGRHEMRSGECVGFPAGTGDAHCFINEGSEDAVILVAGDRSAGDKVDYPDIDMRAEFGEDGRFRFVHKDGTPY